MDNEILTWILVATCAVVFGGVAAWQALRRRSTPKKRHVVDRVGARPTSPKVPTPEVKPEPKPEPRGPMMGVTRPSMLAFTPCEGSVTEADLFVQRALKVDEEHYRTLSIEKDALKALNALFERNCTLEIEPDDGLSRQVYSLNFSKKIRDALRSTEALETNETANDLQVVALSDHAQSLGTPMAVKAQEAGGSSHVAALWALCDPSHTKHALDGLLEDELNAVRKLMPRVKLLGAAVEGVAWDQRWEALSQLVADVRSLDATLEQAQDCRERTEKLAQAMYAVNRRIDESLVTLEKNMRTPEEADIALTTCIPYMLERELSVLFLRTLAVARVVSGDNYLHGMHCSTYVARNVEEFPDVHSLLDKARHIIYDAMEVQGRAMNAPTMDMAGQVKRDADLLGQAHDESVARLKVDVTRVQSAIDHYLILEVRPRRYAVRLSEDNTVEALMVLEH